MGKEEHVRWGRKKKMKNEDRKAVKASEAGIEAKVYVTRVAAIASVA